MNFVGVLFKVKHKSSSSEALIKVTLDKNQKAHVAAVDMLQGNVISLDGIKQTLRQVETDYASKTEPNQLA